MEAAIHEKILPALSANGKVGLEVSYGWRTILIGISMLHGEIKVNDYTIGDWEAARWAILDNDFVYQCKIELDAIERTFYVRHHYSDGTAALVGKVMLGGFRALKEPARDLEYALHLFCERNNIYEVDLRRL